MRITRVIHWLSAVYFGPFIGKRTSLRNSETTFVCAVAEDQSTQTQGPPDVIKSIMLRCGRPLKGSAAATLVVWGGKIRASL